MKKQKIQVRSEKAKKVNAEGKKKLSAKELKKLMGGMDGYCRSLASFCS